MSKNLNIQPSRSMGSSCLWDFKALKNKVEVTQSVRKGRGMMKPVCKTNQPNRDLRSEQQRPLLKDLFWPLSLLDQYNYDVRNTVLRFCFVILTLQRKLVFSIIYSELKYSFGYFIFWHIETSKHFKSIRTFNLVIFMMRNLMRR